MMTDFPSNNSTIEPFSMMYQNSDVTTYLPLDGVNDTIKASPNDYDYADEEYIFDRTYIKIIFISIYSIVFCLCFFGKYT